VRRDLSVSAGLKEVCREVMVEEGDCLARNLDFVDLIFLRMRWGRIEGMEGHASFVRVKYR